MCIEGDEMKSILIELSCPHCGYQSHKKSEQLIVTDFEPKLRIAILENQFFQKECPICHKEIAFLHPCLYQDGIHKFMILLQTQHQKVMPELHEDLDMEKRIVFSSEQLQEKIRILEDELDDIRIELIKVRLCEQMHILQKDITYHDQDIQSDTIWFKVRNESLDYKGIHKSLYHNLEKYLQIDKKEKKFMIINNDTVKDFFNFC